MELEPESETPFGTFGVRSRPKEWRVCNTDGKVSEESVCRSEDLVDRPAAVERFILELVEDPHPPQASQL